jgi:hypothetical protein
MPVHLGVQVAGHYTMARGEPVLSFSAEMTRAKLVQRNLARRAGLRLTSRTADLAAATQ